MPKIETLGGLISDSGQSFAPYPATPQRFRAATPAYEGAAYGRRTVNWNPGNDSVNTALFQHGDILRARSRQMVRTNAWAAGGIATYVSEAIGTGIVPRSGHPDSAKKKQIQELWLRWTDNADSAGIQDFYGLQKMVMQGILEGGEVLTRFRPRLEKDNLLVPLQLQILEAEHLPVTKNELLPNGNVIRGGIELDQIGRRVAYWLYNRHPGEYATFGSVKDQNSFIPVRVPAFGVPSWTSGVTHQFEPIRPGQLRGEPRLSRALVKLNDLDKYTDAELMRKQTAALFAGFITEASPDDPLPGNESASLPDGSDYAPDGISFAGLEPATLQKLKRGEQITFSSPADVGANFEPFLKSALREGAKAMGITYHQLTGDLTGINFSSIRAGLLEFRRQCEQMQHFVIVYQFCRPVWRAFIESAVIGGEISASDYARNQDAYLTVKWIAPGWAWVDPEKDLAEAVGRVRAGFGSRSMVVANYGYDSEEVDAENVADNARADASGLVYTSDPRKTANNGARPDPRDPGDPDGLNEGGSTADPSNAKGE